MPEMYTTKNHVEVDKMQILTATVLHNDGFMQYI